MIDDYLSRKEKIIISAIDILDELGIQGLTSKEIAKRQGVTEPAVYRQFDGKKDIVLTILDRFAIFDEFIKNTVIDNRMEPEEAIGFYLNSYVEYYENYPQITTVMFSFDVYRYEKELNLKMQGIVSNRHRFFSDLIKSAQEKGIVSKEISNEEIAEMGIRSDMVLCIQLENGGVQLSFKRESTPGSIFNFEILKGGVFR